jgi:hypothetical protein
MSLQEGPPTHAIGLHTNGLRSAASGWAFRGGCAIQMKCGIVATRGESLKNLNAVPGGSARTFQTGMTSACLTPRYPSPDGIFIRARIDRRDRLQGA